LKWYDGSIGISINTRINSTEKRVYMSNLKKSLTIAEKVKKARKEGK